MKASQKTSAATILIRIAACALIGVGIMTLFMGLFSSVRSGTMGLAGVLVIGFATVLLAVNPRKSVERPTGSAPEEANSCPICGASTNADQRRCLSCGENFVGSATSGARPSE